MKLKHYRKYQAPRMGSTFLESEGTVCATLSAGPEVDELNNINSNGIKSDDGTVTYESMYFEL